MRYSELNTATGWIMLTLIVRPFSILILEHQVPDPNIRDLYVPPWRFSRHVDGSGTQDPEYSSNVSTEGDGKAFKDW
jgi:hypothetical protein